MLAKGQFCQDCPLRDKGVGFVPDLLSSNAEYVFKGEAPGGNEVQQDKPFVGKAGFALKHWMMQAVSKLKIADEKGLITYANTLRCLPPEKQGRAYPTGVEKEQAEKCCSQYDNWGNAHTVILLGGSAQYAYFREELEAEDLTDKKLGHELKGVMGRSGRVYNKDGKRWVFALHPAFILRQPSLVEHGQRALAIAANETKVLEVQYITWETALQELA